MLNQQTEAKDKRRAAQADLDRKIDAKYPKLTEAEIKTLVVDDKWLAQLSAAVQGELNRVSQTLTGRIRQLADRYATLAAQSSSPMRWRRSAARVKAEHLRQDGGDMETDVGVQADRGRRYSGRIGALQAPAHAFADIENWSRSAPHCIEPYRDYVSEWHPNHHCRAPELSRVLVHENLPLVSEVR